MANTATLEALLTSSYPFTSGVLNLLTVQDLARLQRTCKSIREAVRGCPLSCISFIPPFASTRWKTRIELLSIEQVRNIFYKDVPDNPLAMAPDTVEALDAYGRAVVINYRSISACLRSLTAHQTSGGIRRLVLDRTRFGVYYMKDIFTMIPKPAFEHLVELSFVSCGDVHLGELNEMLGTTLKWPSLRVVKVWDSYDVREFFHGPPYDFTLANLAKLGDKYRIDTTYCASEANHRGETSRGPRYKRVGGLAHIVERSCARCLTVGKAVYCPACVLSRTCEICMKYYCPDCDPWTKNLKAYYDEVWTVHCDQRNGFHQKRHRYHKACVETLYPWNLDCAFCAAPTCPWQEWQTRCGTCGEIGCNMCHSNGWSKRCGLCDRRYCNCNQAGSKCIDPDRILKCKNITTVESLGVDLPCLFWLCALCTEKLHSNPGDSLAMYDLQKGICWSCAEDINRDAAEENPD